MTNAIIRAAYVLAMYTGIRAFSNRVRSLFRSVPRTSLLDGQTIESDDFESLRVRVHSRTTPHASQAPRVVGMISVFLENPGISRVLYCLLRVSSHFGCGHIELAFYEQDDHVCVFAVRNILRSNLDRLGFGERFRNLSLGTERDEIVVLSRILVKLQSQGGERLSRVTGRMRELGNLAMAPQA